MDENMDVFVVRWRISLWSRLSVPIFLIVAPSVIVIVWAGATMIFGQRPPWLFILVCIAAVTVPISIVATVVRLTLWRGAALILTPDGLGLCMYGQTIIPWHEIEAVEKPTWEGNRKWPILGLTLRDGEMIADSLSRRERRRARVWLHCALAARIGWRRMMKDFGPYVILPLIAAAIPGTPVFLAGSTRSLAFCEETDVKRLMATCRKQTGFDLPLVYLRLDMPIGEVKRLIELHIEAYGDAQAGGLSDIARDAAVCDGGAQQQDHPT